MSGVDDPGALFVPQQGEGELEQGQAAGLVLQVRDHGVHQARGEPHPERGGGALGRGAQRWAIQRFQQLQGVCLEQGGVGAFECAAQEVRAQCDQEMDREWAGADGGERGDPVAGAAGVARGRVGEHALPDHKHKV